MLARSYSMLQVISLQNLQSRQTQDKMEVLSGSLLLSLSYVLSRNRDYCPVIVLGKCFLNLSRSINCRIFLYNSRFKTLVWPCLNLRKHKSTLNIYIVLCFLADTFYRRTKATSSQHSRAGDSSTGISSRHGQYCRCEAAAERINAKTTETRPLQKQPAGAVEETQGGRETTGQGLEYSLCCIW